MRRCSECGREITGRLDRVTCSPRCRVARSRRLIPGTIERTDAPIAESKRVGGFTTEG